MRDFCLQLFETFVVQASNSVWGCLAYVALVTAEVVVAPIPGIMLYAPGGLIFGPWLGGFLAVIGNMAGAGLSCLLARTAGRLWLRKLSVDSSVERLQRVLTERGFWLIVVLRLNPATSTDLLSYAAGLTGIPVTHVMLATGLGMMPLCFLQSWLSDSVFRLWPGLIWPMLIAGAVYILIVGWVIMRIVRSPLLPDPDPASET